MIETRSNQRPWRDAVSVLLAVVLVVAVVSVVLDGARRSPRTTASTASTASTGHTPHVAYGPYRRAKARPRLTTLPQPSQAQLGWSIYDAATISDGNSPTGTLVFRLFGPDDESHASAVFQTTVGVNGNGTYYSWQSGALHAARRPDGDVAGSVTYSGDAQRAGDERVRRGAGHRGDPNVVRRPVSAPAHERPGWVVAVGAGLR